MTENDVKYCAGCEHLSGGHDLAKTCDYLLHTGHRRGCNPGVGCSKHTSPPKEENSAPVKCKPQPQVKPKLTLRELSDICCKLNSLGLGEATIQINGRSLISFQRISLTYTNDAPILDLQEDHKNGKDKV